MNRFASLWFLPRPNVRFEFIAAMFGAVLASALATGCGDAVVGVVRASAEAANAVAAEPHSTRSGAQMDDLYSHIRPASVDEPLDPKEPLLLGY